MPAVTLSSTCENSMATDRGATSSTLPFQNGEIGTEFIRYQTAHKEKPRRGDRPRRGFYSSKRYATVSRASAPYDASTRS
jgi:hypothetical protein